MQWKVFNEKEGMKGAIMPSIFKSWPTDSAENSVPVSFAYS